MATTLQVEEFAAANRGLVTLARKDLAAWWRTLDTSDALSVRVALERFLPALVESYGEQAALLAVEYYDELRDAAEVVTAYTAEMAALPVAEQVQARGRWAIGGLFGAAVNANQVLSTLGVVVDELVKQPGRDSIARSAARDPSRARWARVPVGETCSFCLVMASRGAVYLSEASAGKQKKYHGYCDCTPTPVWTEADLPDGYDPDALYDAYIEARSNSNADTLKPILAEIRTQEGIN